MFQARWETCMHQFSCSLQPGAQCSSSAAILGQCYKLITMLAANACQSRSLVLACHGQAKHQTCNLFPILFCRPSLKRHTFTQLLAQPTAPWPVGSLEVRKFKFWEVRSPGHPGIWNTKIHNMNIPDFLIQICVTDDSSS